MKVTEHLARAERPLISFEIIPPKRGGHVRHLETLIEDLKHYDPPFIDITSHASEMVYEETPEGIRKRVVRKRPGTMGVCALIQNKFQIDAVPHVLCRGFTQQETEDLLIELRYLGIENLLALQGDDRGYEKALAPGRTTNTYAIDLIHQVGNMNRGLYLDPLEEPDVSDFCIGAACYPEKHFEAPNMEMEIRRAKEKIEAGAEYLVTQMFFDNHHYFRYVDLLREAGVEVPVIPGLKVLTTKKHLTTIPKIFHCDIPNELAGEIEESAPEHVIEVGARWAAKQTEELFERGAPSVHFYVMSSARPVKALMKHLSL